MQNLNDNQIQIITDLLIDNGLIFNEANNTALILDDTFCLQLIGIRDYCYKLYIDVLNNTVDIELVLNRITKLLNTIAKYRNSYGDYIVGTVGSRMYLVMNSFFDKTNEAFSEFMNQL